LSYNNDSHTIRTVLISSFQRYHFYHPITATFHATPLFVLRRFSFFNTLSLWLSSISITHLILVVQRLIYHHSNRLNLLYPTVYNTPRNHCHPFTATPLSVQLLFSIIIFHDFSVLSLNSDISLNTASITMNLLPFEPLQSLLSNGVQNTTQPLPPIHCHTPFCPTSFLHDLFS
jgi:hypothetical protein